MIRRILVAAGCCVAVTAMSGWSAPRTHAASGVQGVVWDSVAGRPLIGAKVYLMGTGDTATSDLRGAFRITHRLGGRYRLAFQHPRLDSLGYALAPVAVDLAEDGMGEQDLGIPGVERVRAALCGAAAAGDSGVVVGRVVDKADGSPRAGVTLRMEWNEQYRFEGRGGASVERAGVGTTSLPDGRFTLCGVAIEVPLRLSAVRDGRASPAGRLRLHSRDPHFLEVEVR